MMWVICLLQVNQCNWLRTFSEACHYKIPLLLREWFLLLINHMFMLMEGTTNHSLVNETNLVHNILSIFRQFYL